MKKIIMLISLLFLTTNVYATELEEKPIDEITPIGVQANLVRCTTSTNIWLNIKGEDTRVVLLAYGKEEGELNRDIDTYICDTLTNAKQIFVEYDDAVTGLDNYNRTPVWIRVDGILLQDLLIKNGYGQVNYIQGDYKYLEQLCETQKYAISASLGVWNYPEIKEVYCKSGIKVGEKIEEEKEEITEEKRYDLKKLYFILVIDSGIVLLLLFNRKRIKNEKR